MKKSLLAMLVSLACLSAQQNALACTDIFINKGGFHVEGRTMDFPINMAVTPLVGFVGQQNTTNPVVNANQIPAKQLTSWKNKYGYFGRSAFKGPDMIDGMNSQGFSIGILYLPGGEYPTYNAADSRPALSAYDLGSYLLAEAKNVDQALQLINSHQLVTGAVEVAPGYFVKDIPIHYILRDASGNSAVIGFVDGKTVVYKNSGNVLANEPTFDWNVKNAAYYDSLHINNKEANPDFVNRVYQYMDIYNSDFRHAESNLLGVPGDFTSPSRFARAKVILDNYPAPTTTAQALYQAELVNDSMATPLFANATATIWATIKDLDNRVVYYKDYGYYQGDGSFYALPITSGYTAVNLKNIHFNAIPQGYNASVIQATPASEIKNLMSANDMPVFKGVD